jgi:uncharacterized Fe-S center protein
LTEKSKVYWAPPIEVAALPNKRENMVTNNLVKTRFITDKLLDNIKTDDKVGLKVHVGEAHNTHYLRPDFVREVVKAVKSKGGIPTLIETQGRGANVERIEINKDYTTKHNKQLAHFDSMYNVNPDVCRPSDCNHECIKACKVEAVSMNEKSAVIDENICYGCGQCFLRCPIEKAIRQPTWNNVNKFVERFIDNVKAVLSFGPEKIRYINFAFDIPAKCDCVSNASVPVIPDLGIFGSIDPVSIDKACIDMETDAPGLPFLNDNGEWSRPLERGVEKFKALNPIVDPTYQFEAAVKNKIGSTEYELLKI